MSGELGELARKTNESRIADALASLLVIPYPGMETVQVRFIGSEDGKDFPAWMTLAVPEEKLIKVNAVGVLRVAAECRAAATLLKTPEARESFVKYRKLALMTELGKLPTRLLLFLAVLEGVARYKEVSKADKRPTSPEAPENDEYLNLLWAFKELEIFITETTGTSIRTEFNLLWYEAEWINGK